MEEERVQESALLLYVLTADVRWWEAPSSSGGTEPSTSGAPFVDPNTRYIYWDWVFGLSNKKLGFISCKFRLGN